MNATKLLEFFDARRERSEPLVLVTVFETEGSTYSKAGAQMLVDQHGVFRGMLSGGCLEGDLAVRAQQVLESVKPQIATYDLGQDDDELWGMGIGCDGLMRMVLLPLMPGDGFAPFADIADVMRGDEKQEVTLRIGADELDELTILVEPPPQILVLGAGLDAEPTHPFADSSRAVASDRTYLAQLAATDMPYIGLLGPAHRRKRLLLELGQAGASLESRLHGPAGLDIGGRGPAPIALSIIAEMQQELSKT